MALGSKVDNARNVLFLHQGIDSVEVADVRFHKAVVRLVLNVFEVRQVTRVGQLIHIDDSILRIFVHK